VKEKLNRILPVLFLVLVAISRWPPLFNKPGFSAAYALMFCAGVYFHGGTRWWAPLGTMVITDVILNYFYYAPRGWAVWNGTTLFYQSLVYVGYIVIIVLGRRFKPKSSFVSLLGGGLLGALMFYVITNMASWLINPFQNPEYKFSFASLVLALIKGTNGWPDAWEFFRNTLEGGGIFTALFVGAMKLSAAESPLEKEAGQRADDAEGEAAPEAEEAKA
jgi:hypothetical protein